MRCSTWREDGGPRRHAQRHAAVVDAPDRRGRRVALALEAAVGIAVRREHRQRVGHRRLAGRRSRGAAARCRPDRRRRQRLRPVSSARLRCRCRPLPARSEKGFAMKVATQPCFAATPRTRRLNRIASSTARKRVGAVRERDLELPRRVFRHQRTHRQALLRGDAIHLVEQRREVVEAREAVGLDLAALRRASAARRLQLSVGVRPQQVELDLAGQHRLQAQRPAGAARRAPSAWRGSASAGAPAGVVHAEHQLRGRRLEPRRAHQRARDRPAYLVGIARLPDEARRIDVLAGDVEAEDRAGDVAAAAVDRLQLLAPDVLAARHAARVGEEDLHRLDVRVPLEEAPACSASVPPAFIGELRQRRIQCGEQAIDVGGGRRRRQQHHVVERRDQHAAIQQVQVQRCSSAGRIAASALAAGARARGAEADLEPRARRARRASGSARAANSSPSPSLEPRRHRAPCARRPPAVISSASVGAQRRERQRIRRQRRADAGVPGRARAMPAADAPLDRGREAVDRAGHAAGDRPCRRRRNPARARARACSRPAPTTACASRR